MTATGEETQISARAAADPRPLVLYVEDGLYRRFLEKRLRDTGRHFMFVDRASLAQAISQSTDSTLVIQSDQDELGLIEIAARLKRLFADKLRIVLLSTDHLTANHADGVADAFLQFPASLDELLDVVDAHKELSRSVLLIDDSKLVHRTIVEPLKEAGFDVSQAYDGAEGVEMAREIQPRLIICDVEMPHLNGFEVCAKIRQFPEGDKAHIIMLSTLGSATDQQRGFEAGVDEYLTKPVIAGELIDRLDRALRRSCVNRENILVIDQDQTFSKNVANVLMKNGFRPHAESSIRAAMRTLSRIACDLVICEISPRDGSVIELFKALKSISSDRRPDVVIIASRESHVDTRMAMNAGAGAIISKPFSSDRLLASVERTLADRRAKRERAQLQRYVSKASLRMALEKSVMAGDAAMARADLRRATILFSDIVSFTSRCERYAPRQVVEQVNTLFDVMTRVIMEKGGDIDKFMGDACMAFWLDDEAQSGREKAIEAVLAMRHALTEMNRTSPLLSADPIAVRIGLNTGDVILCDIGAIEARVDLTIISDAVNVASRLESATKQYGVDNLISEATIGDLGGRFSTRVVDRVRVKGKREPVACHELFGFSSEASAHETELIETFGAGFAAYSLGNFAPALELFLQAERLERAQGIDQTNPSRVYIDRCRRMLAEPTQDWDGVWSLTSK